MAVPAPPGLGGQAAVGGVALASLESRQPALDLRIDGVAVAKELFEVLADRLYRNLGEILRLQPFEGAMPPNPHCTHVRSKANICSTVKVGAPLTGARRGRALCDAHVDGQAEG